MSEKILEEERVELDRIANELTYQRYLMNEGQIRNFFRKMSIPEYIALQRIASQGEKSDVCPGKTYLKTLSKKMNLTMHQTSKMVENLADQGLVLWQHDGNGSEGTYVTITSSGQRLLREQTAILREYYRKVMERFGKENLVQLLELMKQLQSVMNGEIEALQKDLGMSGEE